MFFSHYIVERDRRIGYCDGPLEKREQDLGKTSTSPGGAVSLLASSPPSSGVPSRPPALPLFVRFVVLCLGLLGPSLPCTLNRG